MLLFVVIVVFVDVDEIVLAAVAAIVDFALAAAVAG